MMKKFLAAIFLMLCVVFSGFAQTNDLPAFPGAEGFGKYTTGGRGGKVIYVTTLNDNTLPGSLRYAINQTGARIIVFKVSGTIQLKSKLNISRGDVTIAGQTAPGDGITLRDYPVEIQADNVVIRFIRFRLGDKATDANDSFDAFWGRRHKNIIIDHCSMSWSIDECASFYDNENFTLQWSILSESLRNSVHAKGSHGYGGIWGGRGASFHHNLLAHHDSRNPRFCGSRYSNRPDDELVDFRNNVIYNWGGNTAYAAEGGSYNLVNNYYKAGPASSNRSRIIQPYPDNGANEQPAGTYGIFYIDGNHVSASSAVTAENWQGVNMHSSFATYAPGVTKDDIKSDTEYEAGEVTTHTAELAFERVLDFVGASLSRDSVDTRITREASTGTVTYPDGGNGSKNGLIDTQDAVGGWPVLETGDAPADSDTDGMPDDWEIANGLLPNDPSDAQLKSVDGVYPNVEVYLNSLVATIIEEQNEGGIPTAVNDLKKNETQTIVYYNGADQCVEIRHEAKINNVILFDISGKMLMNRQFNNTSVQLPTDGLQNGIYIVRIIDENNRIVASKVPVFSR
ncbi:T9SS type A sorting domain-containing protein [Maribellus sediminis]|uniref:T9SS type A sorting domain-containing protein n=1 Tax=Maribellus sediminis TaxID=2696285 RepID=UPI001430586D|nr:T9SS type A sorting domain-containing protein [Maribellus sediminis]